MGAGQPGARGRRVGRHAERDTGRRAGRAVPQGVLPRALQDGLAGFLRRYGHRAVAEIDLGLPRWSDDPTYVLGVLANYLRLDDPEQAPDAQFARGAQAAEATVARIVADVRRRSRAARRWSWPGCFAGSAS